MGERMEWGFSLQFWFSGLLATRRLKSSLDMQCHCVTLLLRES